MAPPPGRPKEAQPNEWERSEPWSPPFPEGGVGGMYSCQ